MVDWRRKTAKERAGLLRRWHDLMLEHREDLAVLMTAEQGKPLAEARARLVSLPAFWSGSPRKVDVPMEK
ncbi:glutarate-semialdehyde dehydrogenase DavD [Halomonas elongata]|uniref:Glutarate-semialdehyde dehydrogenase DavD n=1 Tax=Halomonas elongata TaxID=2746 RepID=A0A1B8P0U2_HALEL|nr:glutarate-semialdehyde dehydrogenase DavD [Halomonas elongata]